MLPKCYRTVEISSTCKFVAQSCPAILFIIPFNLFITIQGVPINMGIKWRLLNYLFCVALSSKHNLLAFQLKKLIIWSELDLRIPKFSLPYLHLQNGDNKKSVQILICLTTTKSFKCLISLLILKLKRRQTTFWKSYKMLSLYFLHSLSFINYRKLKTLCIKGKIGIIALSKLIIL